MRERESKMRIIKREKMGGRGEKKSRNGRKETRTNICRTGGQSVRHPGRKKEGTPSQERKKERKETMTVGMKEGQFEGGKEGINVERHINQKDTPERKDQQEGNKNPGRKTQH